jgi:hypothetical protein
MPEVDAIVAVDRRVVRQDAAASVDRYMRGDDCSDAAASKPPHIFSRRGAYRRYKELLVRRDALERWYDFSNKSEAAALREWCAENGIDLSGT